MTNKQLSGVKVAILVADGFEQSEYQDPKGALQAAGASTTTISLKPGRVKGWAERDWGEEIEAQEGVRAARPEQFDALLLPGGVMSPDALRGDEKAVDFVRHFVESGKPIAAICHGPWTLINAGGVRGRKLTSYHTLRIDLENAGARWEDSSVVTDRGLVTSRKPEDIPEFNRKMIEEFAEGVHKSRQVANL